MGRKIFKKFKKPEDVFTQETIDHPDKQIMEIKCFKNGEYTHTVNLKYFTEKQVRRLQGISDEDYRDEQLEKILK